MLPSQNGFDVFNALDLMHNGEVLKDLKFGIGDGNLQVCSTPRMPSFGIAVDLCFGFIVHFS